jgi:hypothetical protein
MLIRIRNTGSDYSEVSRQLSLPVLAANCPCYLLYSIMLEIYILGLYLRVRQVLIEMVVVVVVVASGSDGEISKSGKKV